MELQKRNDINQYPKKYAPDTSINIKTLEIA